MRPAAALLPAEVNKKKGMKKVPYYIAKTVQVAGLLLVLHAWVVSLMSGAGMNFMFKFTVTGMAIFMAGWILQRFFAG